MANIDEDLQKIMDAVKGQEVRESIHNAIRDINDQTESILATVEAEVEDIVDEAIDNTALLFTYNPRTYLDSDIHLANAMTYADIFAKPLINLRWVVYAGTTALCNASFECFGKREAGNVTQNLGHLYFNNTYTGSIIDIAIPNGGENMYDTFSYTEISLSGLTGGTGIDIIGNTVNVDTTEIQEKLIAGTGINITGNTISSTGGGGTSDIVTVVYTFNFSTEDCTCNTSYNDILTAYNNGKTIIPLLKQNSADYVVYPGVFTYSSGMINMEFSILDRSSTGGVQLNYISITHVYDDVELDDSIQASKQLGYGEKYTSGTGIDITNNVISIDLQNAEDNSF